MSPHGFPGWGLFNDTSFQADLAGAIALDHPEVILMMWSWDNAYATAHPAAYLRRLTEAIDVMLAPGDGVDGIAIIQFPKVGPNDAIINPTQRQQAERAAEVNRQGFDRIVSNLPPAVPGEDHLSAHRLGARGGRPLLHLAAHHRRRLGASP